MDQKANETVSLGPRDSPPGLNVSVESDDSVDSKDDAADFKPVRQDLFVCFTNDKDLRHHETISIKASLYKGIAVRVKILNHIQMENILFAIETADDLGIVNLRFEECRILKKGVLRLIEFCKTTEIIESLGLVKVTFDDTKDFKTLVESVQNNKSIKQFAVNYSDFNEDFYGKTFSKLILESASLKEIDLSYVIFRDQRSFYEMANGLLNERCNLGALKLRGISFNQLEGQVMQFILTKNQSLQTLDISQCSTDSPEILENVFLKFDSSCTIKTLVVENSLTDFNHFIEAFGEALGQNTCLEGLSLKDNAIKQANYCLFWELMSENRSLKKINLQKTEVTNRVCSRLGSYLMQPGIILQDLNLSRNSIEAGGLIALAEALHENTSIIKLNLAQNLIQEGGLEELVSSLKVNTTLRELCLSLNKINNVGLEAFSGFLSTNETMTVLDLSKNQFSDFGFVQFAKQLAFNRGIESLNLQKNKDVTDDVGLRQLANALAVNASLAIIDLSGLKIRKPCIIQYFQPALQSNITLKKIIGKIPPGIISDDLKDNVTIESDITSKYKTVQSSSKRQQNQLPMHSHQGDYTQLDLSNQANELLTPALKFIRYRCIHGVNLSNMQLEDESLRLLSLYLEENPILRSMAIADNFFTDDGLGQLIQALRGNTHLNHLDIQGCNLISSLSIRALDGMITEVNMSLYAIELERDQFEPRIVKSVMTQAKYNMAIQMHLKPTKIVHEDNLIEIKFCEGAGIAEHFDAAMKTWRIMSPTMIQAINEGLEDAHVEQLCEFLSHRNLIKSLNLRRNKIGNTGAIALANFIRKADKTLQILELERNQIQDEGGEELLKATQSNMRIEVCNMSFGNPMRQKICRQVEREIQANVLIKAQVVPVYKQQRNSLPSYEESDRGPDFARCALKSCELFKILHLSLPDNMIGLKEAIDISYVIAKNTPLRSLNLSQNAIDAKAALILSEGLAQNSNIREIDLRQNLLEDSGIAVFLRPFIMQKIDRFQIGGGDLNKSLNRLIKKTKVSARSEKLGYEVPEKLKMKIDRILLDENNQTGEALKHIYTTLVINENIEISIDMPEQIPVDLDEKSEDTDFDFDDSDSEDYIVEKKQDLKKDLSPTGNGAVLPFSKQVTQNSKNLAISRQGTLALSRQQTSSKTNQEKQALIDPVALAAALTAEQQEQAKKEEEEAEDNKVLEEPELEVFDDTDGFVEMATLPEAQKKIPYLCRLSCCSRCRKLRYRDPNKPNKACIQLCCPSFFQSRVSANRFKMSTELLQDSETGMQPKFFFAFLAQILLFVVFGILLPLLLRNDKERCQPYLPTQVYACYVIFVCISGILEIKIFNSLSNILKQKDKSQNKCNSYLLAKGIQGQLANLSTFVHIGFCAHVLSCNKSDHHDLKEDSSEADNNNEQSAHVWQQLTSYVLAIISGVGITLSNYNRFRYILKYFKTQPHIHTILPNTYRNIQFAWISNMQSVAIILESTSLSEYMIELGGPITKNKPKEGIDPSIQAKLNVKSISEQLISNKLKFQDIPMLLVFIVHFLTHINILTEFDMIVFFVKIGIVGLATLSSLISHKWKRNTKRVNYIAISELIEERIQMRKEMKVGEIKQKEISIKNQKLEITQSYETQGSVELDLGESMVQKEEGQKGESEILLNKNKVGEDKRQDTDKISNQVLPDEFNNSISDKNNKQNE